MSEYIQELNNRLTQISLQDESNVIKQMIVYLIMDILHDSKLQEACWDLGVKGKTCETENLEETVQFR